MILTGTNYNIRSDAVENQRLHGSGLYNQSSAEHFRSLYDYKPVIVSGGAVQTIKKRVKSKGGALKSESPTQEQKSEVILRVLADKPRRQIKSSSNAPKSISGRSTAGIEKTRRGDKTQSVSIMKINTKREMEDNQQPIKAINGLKR